VRIEGRTFLVTGGRSGLGEATAHALEEAGGRVVIADLPETDVTDEDGVSMSPGAIVQTRMPTAARSRAAVSVSETTPPFDAEYAAWPIWPS